MEEKRKVWFLTLLEPRSYSEFSPKFLTERALETWIESGSNRRGFVCYCTSCNDIEYLYMILEDSNGICFPEMQALFPMFHIESYLGDFESLLCWFKENIFKFSDREEFYSVQR